MERREWLLLTFAATTAAIAYTPKAEISIFFVCANTKSAGRNTYRLYCWYRSRAPKNVPSVRSWVSLLPGEGEDSSARMRGTSSTGRFHCSAALLPTTRSPSVM